MEKNLKGAIHDAKPTHYQTSDFARLFGAEIQTPRASYCRKGHWLGIKPVKLPNGRLMWPADAINALLEGVKNG